MRMPGAVLIAKATGDKNKELWAAIQKLLYTFLEYWVVLCNVLWYDFCIPKKRIPADRWLCRKERKDQWALLKR